MTSKQSTSDHQNLISDAINAEPIDGLEDDQSFSSTGKF